MPGLLKLWLDKIFPHGFSHGRKGKLGGKKQLFSFTTGAPAVAYQKDGSMKHTVEDYFPAFETTATLCNLDFVEPIYTCGISYTARDDAADIRALAKNLPLRCILEQRSRDWAVSKSGKLVRREFVDLAFERV